VLQYLAEICNDSQQDRARPLYERAIGLDASPVMAWIGVGAIHFEHGEYGEAARM
jgi:hypothetical protein